MAVREFNGTTDVVVLDIGGLTATTFGTFGAIFKVTDTATFRALWVMMNSGPSFVWAPILIDTDDTAIYSGTGDVKTTAAIPQGTWLTFVVRKATGTATPRFSYYNHTSTTWTHGNATGTTGNGTAPGAGGSIRTTTDVGATAEPFIGRVAVTACWSNAVHWSADGTGDTAIEAAGLHTSLQNWVDEAPDMLVPWDPTVAAGLVDIAGTSNQLSITGTTQITVDDPPGFSFDLGGPELMPRAVIVVG